MPTPIYIVGPTATGKTSLALALARELDGEIVGADAFQIYRGMPILTAGPSDQELTEIPHHLIGEVDPQERMSAARYAGLAIARIEEIIHRGRQPIVVGGTGLYIKALTTGLATLPDVDLKLRASLVSLTAEERLALLTQHDPAAPADLDIQNPRRVQRALEIVLQTGQPLSKSRVVTPSRLHLNAVAQGVFLDYPAEELRQRILMRTRRMFHDGVMEEVEQLGTLGTLGVTASQVLGLAEVRAVLLGNLSQEAAILLIAQRTGQLAKRQRTWFRNQECFPAITADLALDAMLATLRS